MTSATFSLPEHSAAPLIVGRVNGSSIVTTAPLNFSLSPAGANVNNPFPFAIRTVAVPGGNGYGQIYVTGGPINFSPWNGAGTFSSYAMTVTVTDSRLGAANLLTASAPVTVIVTWVAEPPFWNAAVTPPAYLPNSAATTVFIRETVAAGSNASSGSDGVTGAPAPGETLPEAEPDLYRAGYDKYKAQDWEGAVRVFSAYTNKFPGAPQADNAFYLMAEALTQREDFPASIRVLQVVLQKYSSGDKVDDAHVLMHDNFVAMKRCKDAMPFLETLIAEFPSSSRVADAKKKLAATKRTCR